MRNNLAIPINKMVPITYARRHLGGLLKRLTLEGELYLLRGSKVAAKLTLPETDERDAKRKEIISEVFGAWKNSDLDNDALWREILVKERASGTKKKPLSL